jgi:hypothetical protein
MDVGLVKEAGKKGKEKRTFDPCRDRSSCQESDAIVRERIAVEDEYHEWAAAAHLHAECHYPRYDTARLQGVRC